MSRSMRRRLLLAGGVALPLAFGAPVLTRAVAQAEAERQLDAAIARLRTGLGPGGAVEWRARSVDPATGTARFQDVSIRRGANRVAAAELVLERAAPDRIGRAVASNVTVEEAQPPAGGGTPGPITVTAGRVTLGDLLLPNADGGPALDLANLAVGEAQAEGIRMRNPGRGESELGRLTLAGYAPGAVREATIEGFRFHDRSPDKGEVRMNIGRARLAGAAVPRIGAAFDPWALAADTALIEGAEILSEKQQTNIRLGRLQLDGWGTGRLTTLALEGAKVDGETAQTGPYVAELGRVAVAGVPLRDTVHAIVHDVAPPANRPGQEQTASVEGLSVSAAGAPVLAIGSLRGRNGWDPANAAVEAGTLAAEGIALNLPAEYGGDQLAELGFKRILARFGIDSRLTRTEGRLTAEPFQFQAQGMGTLALTMDIRGVTIPQPGQPNPPKDDPMALAAEWSVAAMSIRYTEEGLIHSLLARQAAQENVPERTLRERYAGLAARTPIPGAQGKDGPQIMAVRNAFASFARDLGTIEIAMRPARPLPLLEFATLAGRPPEQAVRELNLTARATPPAR